MANLQHFNIDDLAACTRLLHKSAEGAVALDDAAQAVTEALYDCLQDDHGDRACALVRFYKTHRFADLEPDQQRAAIVAAGSAVPPQTKCFTLFGTSGAVPDWNDRRRSRDHQAIPLLSEASVARVPMIASLIEQLGLDVRALVAPNPDRNIELHHRDYKVFLVPEAAGSPLIPAQGFVAAYGVKSVVGVGGVLPSGDLFAVLLFSKVPVSERAADLLRSLALSVKAAVVPFTFRAFRKDVART